MKFYNREKELLQLSKIQKASLSSSKMTFIVGRRRIGKTKLVIEAFKELPMLYFFVAKKDERLLCEEYINLLQTAFNIKVFGEITNFRTLFEYLLQLSETKAFTLVIDEFQEFYSINSAIYSEMQNVWDRNKESTKMNLILSGSVYSLMKKIFENYKEPLFGRADKKIYLKPFSISTLKEIMQDFNPTFTSDDILGLYVFTGGVAKYVELFVDENVLTFDAMLDFIFEENSPFLYEGRDILIEEFGKEYNTYFSILSLIASSKTARSEIESILQKNIGGYLDRMENEYSLIKKVKPIFAKEGSRTQKYQIEDNFLNFWFRFIYKYRSSIEIGNYEYVKQIVKRDWAVYSGRMLEKYFYEFAKLSNSYTQIGIYWERGNQNEIDLVCVNDEKKEITFIEIKRNKKKINLELLKQKSIRLLKKLGDYEVTYQWLSVEDM